MLEDWERHGSTVRGLGRCAGGRCEGVKVTLAGAGGAGTRHAGPG